MVGGELGDGVFQSVLHCWGPMYFLRSQSGWIVVVVGPDVVVLVTVVVVGLVVVVHVVGGVVADLRFLLL